MRLLTYVKPQSFYDIYTWKISPKLQKIDLFLKSSGRGICPETAARLLDISGDEVRRIMCSENIPVLDRNNFFRLILRGSSEICRYISREAELGSPLTYTKDEIAYIYGLDVDDVSRACDIAGITEATAMTLPIVFCNIPVA